MHPHLVTVVASEQFQSNESVLVLGQDLVLEHR